MSQSNDKMPTTQINESQITFDDFDKLNLKAFAENLFQMMEKGTASSIKDMGKKGSYTVSLNAEFGNGKTTFLKMFEHFIKEEKENYDVLFIDAWRSDFYGEPVIAILSEFVNWMEENQANTNKIKKWKETVGKISMSIGSQLISSKIGIDVEETISSLEKKGSNLLKAFKQRKEAIKQIKTTLSEYKEDKKLLVIVDELDRTRPDYAVHFLEDMKHFFDIEGVVFLVAVNKKQMEATVKCLYGQELDFNGYYRKFFKQEVDLPDPYKEAQRLVTELILKTNVQPAQNDETRKSNAYLSCKMFQLTLREIEYFVSIFEMILGNKSQTAKWMYMDCYSFFICLFLKEKAGFNEALNGSFTVKKFCEFVKEKKLVVMVPYGSKEAESVVNDNNFLLGTVAYSFMIDKKSTVDKDLILDTFQLHQDMMNHIFSPSDGFSYYSKPALDICEKISKCESAFDK